MKKIKFIHISKDIAGDADAILMPMGFIALANYLSDKGYDVEIIHEQLERKLNSDYCLVEDVCHADIICINLHWHYQSYNVLNAIKEIKECAPKISIVVGGFTASFFAEEIMSSLVKTDFIIRGDAEIPLDKLVKLLCLSATNYDSVPNLVWRKNNQVTFNPQTYTATKDILKQLNYSNMSTIRHYQKYMQLKLNDLDSFFEKEPDKYFYYNCGRGCPVDCSFCGGSATSQMIINARNSVVMLDLEDVIKELERAIKVGYTTWYTCFDPYPSSDYYPNLFKEIRKKNIRINCEFECWSLPSDSFIKEFSKAFNLAKSWLIISPESGNEEVRSKNKGYSYTNKKLYALLDKLQNIPMLAELYFTVGLPFENTENVSETKALMQDIKQKYEFVNLKVVPLQYEPGAPLFLNPNKYGVKEKRHSFNDFYEAHRGPSSLGYRTKCLSEVDILKYAFELDVLTKVD